MYLGFFILSALDLLDALTTVSSENERHDYAEWIYRCQHSRGGFRMWPGTDFGERANEANAQWDPANIPATYFALASLLILKDDFRRVRRRETLLWLHQMQRPDGSFGETLVNGHIEGGNDPRYGYCAAGIRYVLRGAAEDILVLGNQAVQDIDVVAFVSRVRAAEVGTLATKLASCYVGNTDIHCSSHMMAALQMNLSTNHTQATPFAH